MNNKIIIINGPNLNLLGEREQSQYGSTTYDQLKRIVLKKQKKLVLMLNLLNLMLKESLLILFKMLGKNLMV